MCLPTLVRPWCVAAISLLVCAASAVAGTDPPCNPNCEGAISENEPCGTDVNNGCHGSGKFGNIYCGKPVCGELWVADAGTSFDVDWFTLDLSGAAGLSKVTASVRTSMPVSLYLVDANCADPMILAEGAGACPMSATACVAPGIYRVLLVPAVLDGYPCGAPGRTYRLEVSCEQVAQLCCDDDAIPTDANGDPILPADWDGDPVRYKDINLDRGRVPDLYPGFDTSLDLWYDQMPCDPTLGDGVTKEEEADDLPAELSKAGIDGDPDAIIATLAEWESAIARQVALEPNGLAVAPAVVPAPFTPSGPHCPPAGLDYVFGGRDIILIHGLRLEHLVDRFTAVPGADAQWRNPTIFPGSTENPEFYAGGYFKHRAELNWKDYIDNFLTARNKKNRYLVVSYASTERLEVAVRAVLTQIADAMRDGTGVVDPSGCNNTANFGTPSFVVLSHSTGALVTDASMYAAATYPGLGAGFIPHQCKAHIAPSGAFLGSDMATAAVGISGLIPPAVVGWGCALAQVAMEELDPDAAVPPCGPPGHGMKEFAEGLVRNSVLVDLVPSVAQGRWGASIAGSPVRTLSSVAGHPTQSKPMKYLLHRGLDDGVVTINSQVPNPNPVVLGASVFFPDSVRKALDKRLSEGGAPKRAKGYYKDAKKDRELPSGAIASGATRWLSPTGMLQPLSQYTLPGYDPHARYANHYTFTQSASSHKAAVRMLSDYPNYQSTGHGAELNWEETRVLTDPAVYSNYFAGMADMAPLLTPGCMLPLHEEVAGRKIVFRIKLFGKVFRRERWVWRRAYHLLENARSWHQIDYIHHSVLCTPLDCSGSPCAANVDLNGDGAVNAADLGLLLAAWGQNTTAADFNSDGIVDGADLGVLLAGWTGG